MKITKKHIIDNIINKRLKIEEFESLASVEQGCDKECFNKFFGEIVPLKTLAKKLSCARVTVLPDGHQFDAILHFSDKDQYAEFTLAIDGYHRSLLYEHGKNFGHTFLHNEIKTNGKKKNSGQRKVLEQESPMAIPEDTLKSKLKEEIQRAIQNKYNKSKPEDKEAYLVAVFFRLDYLGLTNEDIKEIIDQLILDDQKFTKHCFIGWQNNELQDFFYLK
jgi:hypothetical protein